MLDAVLCVLLSWSERDAIQCAYSRHTETRKKRRKAGDCVSKDSQESDSAAGLSRGVKYFETVLSRLFREMDRFAKED